MSHFSDVGFEVETPEDLERLILTAVSSGEQIITERGSYIHWQVGDGVEMWLQADRDDEVIGFNPHFRGPARMRVGVTRTVWEPDMPLDGSLYCWANPTDDDPSGGDYPFLVDMPDFGLSENRMTLPAILTLQIAAFAHEITVFADESAFQDGSYKLDDGTTFAAESFVPAGLFVEEGESPRAVAMLSGRIEQYSRLSNAFSRQSFDYITVRTLGGTLDVVADPVLLADTPTVGGLVQGTFWLSARMASDVMGGARGNGRHGG